MKKLLIAAFAASSICAFADEATATAINSIDFESVAVDTAATAITEGVDQKYFKADASDASAVKAYDEEKTAPTKETKFFTTAGNNYLNLETEGGTLWRTINPLTIQETEGEGGEITTTTSTTPKAFESQIYLDTLVQFTATEDDVNTLDGDAKFALWLYKGENDETAQLKVMAGNITGVADNAELAISSKTYALTGENVTVEAGVWYRLTIKSVNLINAESGNNLLGFAIYIDGTLMSATETIVSDDIVSALKNFAYEGEPVPLISDSQETILKSNNYFPARVWTAGTTTSLTEVGFKGTGAIDNIAWTDDEIMEGGAPANTEITIEVATGTEVSVQIADLVSAGFVAEGATAEEAAEAFTETKTTVGGKTIAAWQAYYLGLYDPASQDKTVEDVEIDSISFDANGNVVVTMKGTPVENAPVAITYTLKKCADIANPSWTVVESTTDPDAIKAAKGEADQSFYKVEVSFGAKQQAAE